MKIKITLPKKIKLKIGSEIPPVILANLQDKSVVPKKQSFVVVADEGFDGLKNVSVEAIPDEYIIPNGEIEITENGVYNVEEKATANVNIPNPEFGTKTITKNGVYNASDDNLDGYSSVSVETAGVDINDYFETIVNNSNRSGFMNKKLLKNIPQISLDENVTDLSYFCSNWNYQFVPFFDTKNVTSFTSCFANSSIVVAPPYNTSKAKFVGGFLGASTLIEIPLYDFGGVISLGSGGLFTYATLPKLTNIGGFKDLGKAYSTTQSANYSAYTLNLSDCPNLTHESLMNVINNLYDIATKGCNTQKLQLGATNLAKLTDEEKAIAINKGWSIS